ncbi:palmitoyl-monogalactosyldiacylglycerol delta-7 desaturase, chloroplastic-like [Cucurbita pepo subsp. pepo]|uniref:palmitoyl-monogalactosyldiacylglycerol delta-7 desaturase, chloroplastic-like n=1 Tax=Cucurbita pepo subsp. pepo TaxID=3664 RepID=UPI000C9D3BD3|nr:palmitoyl-monogalactosyldiacylglycerol delta-7 desaturase, chloroplastic-like [Cucurbita pepo subsp. pepo]
MALLNSRPTHSKFHRLTSLRREIHRPRLPIIRLTPIPGDPLPLNYVGCCDFKALRLNSPIQIQNRAIPPPAEAFESQSPTPPTPLAAADGRRILLSDVVVRRQREVFWGRKWTSLDIGTAGVVVATHLLTLLAPFHFNWAAFWVAISLYIATGLFGITLSFHRNLSHRSFKLPKWLEYLFAYCGVQALQGNPIDWVSTHRYHHQFCDSERDPHSPIEGFWFSHMSWLFDTNSIVQRCGEPNNVGDLQKQPFYRFIQNTYLLHPIALAALLYAIGGFPFIVWGMGVRIVWVYHITWLVNSACHVWGKQAWKTGDLSRNNWWVALLAFGEGWHNNHHAFEFSARHGLEWWQLDMTWYVVRLLQALGLATDVKIPTQVQKEKLAIINTT